MEQETGSINDINFNRDFRIYLSLRGKNNSYDVSTHDKPSVYSSILTEWNHYQFTIYDLTKEV